MHDETRKLYRVSSDQMIGGVCSGLGRYFEIDPTVIRLFFIGGFFANFPMTVFLYLVLLALMPIESSDEPSQAQA